ncbi:MAG: NAD(P)/FAD-dependent oxidoreductase [Methanomassiliicoccales archaeon]|nr:MAG: NAD(P)/FAD-dependent oxidoreductase [Methanomassiliicoccales archaeon]
MALDYDIVVVGAGPAGSLTAKHAAVAGANVLILEKRPEVGSPVRCGEGLDKNGLARMGIKPDKKWIANEVKGAHIYAPNGRCLELKEGMAGNEVGYVIKRDIFDKELAKDAIRAGADIMIRASAIEVIKKEGAIAGVKAKHMGERFEVSAKIVVGADGFESQVGRWAGIDTTVKPKDIYTCFQYDMVGVDIDSDYSDFFLGSCAPGGYAWAFPKGKHRANVGLGLQVTKIKGKGEPKRYLDAFVKARKGLSKGTPIAHIAGAVSVCAPIEKTVGNGILLVGDAARQIDPMTGGGIVNSGIAAQIAGKVAAESIQAKDYSTEFLSRYEKGWRKELEDKLYRNWLAKEKLTSLSDDTINKIIEAIAEYDIERISVLELLKAVKAKYPELVKEFEDLLM